jgi:hypothetical protein
MAFEQMLAAVPPQAFTANGTNLGVVTIASTAGFYIKQKINLQSNTIPNQILLQIKNILSDTQLIVGPNNNSLKADPKNYTDISTYLVADNATISAPEQNNFPIPGDDHYNTVFLPAPVMADRVVWVDPYGNFYGPGNPLPISFDGTISIGTVTVTNLPNPVSTNYGTVNNSTIRTASQIGNATGSADFGVGIVGPQTLRVGSNLYDSNGNGLTSTPIDGKQALDVNIAGDSFTIDVGTPDESAFTYGTSLQQTIGGVYQDAGPTIASGESGAVRLTQYRAFHTNLRNSSGTELDYNFGAADTSTLRVAALIGNATGSADFGAGNSDAQTLRVVIASNQNAIPVTQSTSPWIVSGTVTANQGTSPWIVSGTVAVTQSTSPWITSDLADGAVSNGITGTKSTLGGLIYDSSTLILTSGNQNSLLGDVNGNLLINLKTSIPTGSNTIGAVTQASGPWTQNLTEVGGAAISLGQTTAANSVPVTLAGLPTFQTSQYTVGTSAVQITAAPLTNRSSIGFKAITTASTYAIYIGNSSSVTAATGYPLFNDDTLNMDLTGANQIWAIASATAQTLAVVEIA